MQKVLLRYLAYTFAVFLGMTLIIAVVSRVPGGLGFDRSVSGGPRTSEFSPVELLQNVLLIFSAASFAWVAQRDRLRRPMALSLTFLMLVCLVRELDFFLDFYLVDNLWQVLCGLLISFALVYGIRQRSRLVQGWKRSWPSAGLALIMGGFIMIVPFAQMVGNGALWEGILGDNYVRVVKVAAEEFAELGGYALIALGTVEFLYAWSRLPRKRGSKVL
jgi:hypothetical protein